MALKEYRRKRTFAKTPEPRPARAPAREGWHFVVHKHQASHLHYDLRLELGGVLKSWAVPKGPSTDPHDKRLAIMVEDHPLEYRHFKGRIPKGEYGAGLVEIWDQGTYAVEGGPGGDPAKVMAAGLVKGHIDFRLKGKKLEGLFTLVRLKPRGDGKDNQWLLMKRTDPAPAAAPAGRAPGSKADPPARRRPVSLESLGLKGAPRGPFPGDVEPMLATLVDEPFDREGWSFEIKWDGFRSIAEVKGGNVSLVSRNGKSQNARFPTVAAALAGFPVDTVLDGEIVAVDEKGRPDFQALQNSMRAGDGRLLYYVFDVLQADGYDLRPLALERRRAILEKLLPASKVVRLSEAIETKGQDFFRAAEKNGLEGIMAKDLKSPYRPGQRSREWLKIKTEKRQEAVICGFTKPRASRKHFGALILGAYRNGRLTYIGSVGTGFTEQSLKDLSARLAPLVASKSPFAEAPETNMPVTWVSPRLVGEVKFREWTAEGLMRQPVFLGLRDDKSARQVVRETASAKAAVFDDRPRIRTKAELTHLDKVFWPLEGYTKGDLIDYYWKMADRLLPYLEDRPQALNRHPDGIAGESFFQKNITQEPPEWVKTVKVRSEGESKDIRYLLCQNRDTLIYEANLGAIELNVWSSSLPHLDSPDYLVLDFDPLETSFPSVVKSVQAAKEVLDELEIPAFCKTSGATGLHVYVPLEPRFSYDQAQQLAHLVLLVVNGRNPDLTSLERSPAKRRGRVYLDYLQNRKGATMAAPYSVRPREGAPVSMPLDWKAVASKLEPLDFNIRTAPGIVAKKGDAWKNLFKERLDLNAALARFEKWRKSRKSR